MSDAPRPPEPEDTPSEDELRRISMPARLRRAPRFGRVVGTGVTAGFVAGALCGLLLPNSTGVGRGMVAILVGLGFALIGGMVTGLIAIGLDRGTPRYLKTAPASAWPPPAPGDAAADSAPASAAGEPATPSTPDEERR
ncbi:hypothetical protein [Demequina muriae]|uniref:Uncharacterized protein n=1 Tax=Demequina muriae TaxID=3051664 RepID=A0ABT8GFW1_9MICO|nr:hypothetical protein [Demequina sp. EGI L300058]MDN4480327.1 hypothetical protein [Demequina sp. EGI L300058]